MTSTEYDSFLTTISPHDLSWDKHRRTVEIVKNTYSLIGENRLYERMNQCSNRLIFRLVEAEQGDLKLQLTAAKFCRVRYCPLCQWRRALMWRARFISVLPRVLEDFPTHRWLFLTLTVRNCDVGELRSQVSEMNAAWSRMTKRVAFPAVGWVRTLEVTRALDNSAHPHFHALLMVRSSYFGKGYMKQAEWTELWKESLRVEYTPVVNIKSVSRAAGNGQTFQQSLIVGVCETLKYSVKETDLISCPQWLGKLTTQLHNTRAIAVGGCLRGYLSESEPENLINTEEDDGECRSTEAKIAFDWDNSRKKYRQTELVEVM